jgi:hypothetical protein
MLKKLCYALVLVYIAATAHASDLDLAMPHPDIADPANIELMLNDAPAPDVPLPDPEPQTLTFCALSQNCNWTGAHTFTDCPQIVYATCVDGITYAQTNAGIQAAVNATPSGGTIFLPAATYALTGGGSQQISITKSINFICSGWGANLQLQSGAASVPLLRIDATGAGGFVVYGIRIQDCQFSTAVGGLGTYAIQVDTATTGSVGKLIIDHVYVGCGNTGLYYCTGGTGFGTGSIFFNNPTGTGGYYQSSIAHSKIYGGIKMTRAGDSITWSDNEIIPNAAADIFYVDAYPGSTLFRFQNNFMRMPFRTANDTAGSSALQSPIFDGNVWEPESAANLGFSVTETNNAMLDLDGSATSNVTYASITKNSFQANANSYTLNAVRLNYATESNIGGFGYINFFGITTSGCGATTCHGLITTANSGAGNRLNHNAYSTPTWTGSSGSIIDDVAGNTLITEDAFPNAGQPLISQGSGGGTNIYGASGLAFELYGGSNCMTDSTSGNVLSLCAANNPSSATIPSGITTAFVAASGPTPSLAGTGACATFSTQSGGSSVGLFKCTGTSGAATIIITPGFTAQHGWRCDARDETTTADTILPTVPGSNLTTTCTFTSAAIVSGDVISFTALPF